MILSARNLKILTRDRSSLILMLASAPLVAMLDVLLSFVMGRDLFSFYEGDAANAVGTANSKSGEQPAAGAGREAAGAGGTPATMDPPK